MSEIAQLVRRPLNDADVMSSNPREHSFFFFFYYLPSVSVSSAAGNVAFVKRNLKLYYHTINS